MKKILFFSLFFLFCFKVFPYQIHLITEESVNVRVDSTILSEDIGSLKKGDKVEVLEERYDWFKIRLPDRFLCYVSSKYLDLVSSGQAKVNGSNLNIRSKPSLESHILGKLKKNTLINVTQSSNDWTEFKCYPYATGWIHKRFVKLAGRENQLQGTINTIIPKLSQKDLKAKKDLHYQLIVMGEDAFPLIERYLPSNDAYTNYSLIFVLTSIAETNPRIIGNLFKKVTPSSPELSGIYLDIIQNVLNPSGEKKPFYFLAGSGRLTSEDIENAKRYLEGFYNKSKQ